MKYKLLSISSPKTVNIGDYVQTLASRQFLPNLEGFVERDELKRCDGEECAMIMNGWYMHQPLQWPPSPKIHPLFVSVHINKLAKDTMLQGEGLEYLKAHAPIGCRDYYTVGLLKEKGIDAYFSGCMTLTLGETYRYKGNKRENIYFVDANVGRIHKYDYPMLLFQLLFSFSSVRILYQKNWRYISKLRHWCPMTRFYTTFSKVFSKETLMTATYISQECPYFKDNYKSNESLMHCADELLKKYAKAEMVVTSRFHCALSCTGMGTPVIYVNNIDLPEVNRCRLDVLLQLFNILKYSRGVLDASLLRIDRQRYISPSNMLQMKTDWKPIADSLIVKCKEWIRITSNQKH